MRQGRTDAWIAHQLDVSVGDIRAFKREHELAQADAGNGDAFVPGTEPDEPDLRAEDDALVAEALEAERQAEQAEEAADDTVDRSDEDEDDGEERPKRRRRGRRGGRGRTRSRKPKALDGTFDHGEEGYGLWLDPAVQDDPTYAEHWAGHRPVTVTIEPARIVISRAVADAVADVGAAARPRSSRAPSTTARRATGCGSIRRSRTIRSTPSTGPATAP